MEASPHKAVATRPPTTHRKNYNVWRTRHAGHCWRSRDELISDALLWTSSYGRAKTGRPARIYILQFCADTGCIPEDLPGAMNDREGQVFPGWWPNMVTMITLCGNKIIFVTKVMEFSHLPIFQNIACKYIWGVSENKTNATSHPNIGSVKTDIEEYRNKISEEFILNACRSFRMRVDKIIENKSHII